MRILFALLSVAIGLVLVFSGYRFARVLIPLMGFLTGLSLGGAVYSDLSETPFLATFAGISVGFFMGIILAALAYAYYYMAVVILAAGLGYWLGSSFILWLGFNPGVLSAVIGVGLGLVVGIFAIMANAPKYTLIVLTAIFGAVATAGGIMLLFNVIPLDAYSYATASFAVRNSFFWTVAALVLIAVGIASQIRSTVGTYEFEQWGTDRGHHLPPTATTHMGGAH